MKSVADFSFGDIVKFEEKDINDFINNALLHHDIGDRYRVCLHDNPENTLQEMFIYRFKGEYYRPEKHEHSETHIAIRGKELMIFFDDEGNIEDYCLMDSQNTFICRTNNAKYHMTIVLSDLAIDYEVAPGPFVKKDHIFPDWAPVGNIKSENDDYIKKIISKVGIGYDENQTI